MKHDEFDRVVRYVYSVLGETLNSHLFEPNDGMTRAMIVNTMARYLQDLQHNRCISDFKIVCSDENNSPMNIDRDELNIDIFIQPVYAVDYVTHISSAVLQGQIQEDLYTASSQPTPEEIMSAGSVYSNHTYGATSITQTPALISLVASHNGDTKLSFTGEEGDSLVLAEFDPERNITTFEYMHIVQLQLLLISAALTGQNARDMINPIEIIRRHNLERHFKFSEF